MTVINDGERLPRETGVKRKPCLVIIHLVYSVAAATVPIVILLHPVLLYCVSVPDEVVVKICRKF